MEARRVGIGDLRFYVPRNEIRLDGLVARRVQGDAKLERHLTRALQTTGQRAIRFPTEGEDTVTMAAEAARQLLAAAPGGKVAALRWIVAGTETGVDHSKTSSSYVQGLLQRSGLPIPTSLATLQAQHACAGGALGLLSVAGLVALGRGGPSRVPDTGLVLSSDISRYALSSTAEITQGSGAAAMLVETEPRLLEFEPAEAGFASHDVDDFFRPLGSVTAKVKGGYSMECYLQSLDESFGDHAARLGRERAALLGECDAVVLHTPFRNMPEVAMFRLLAKDLGLDEAAARQWLERRSFFDSVDLIADIGNAYSASIFILLASTLAAMRRKHGDAIVGKKVLFASYGSGNVMAVITMKVAAGAGAVIDAWDLDSLMGGARAATMDEYDAWTAGYQVPVAEASAGAASPGAQPGGASPAPVSQGPYRLLGIREDGYRVYGT